MGHMVERLDTVARNQDVLARNQDDLARKQDVLARNQDDLARNQDDFWENSARSTVAQMFGERYSRQYTVKSLLDLVVLAEPSDTYSPAGSNTETSPTKVVKAARDLGESLVKGEFHKALLRRIMGALVRLRVVSEGDSPEKAMSLLSRGPHKDTPTLRLISWLLKVQADDLDDLIECNSCGVALAVYASNRAAYDAALDAASAAGQIAKLLPTTEVEFDVRGRIEVVGDFCAIACGELKNSGSRMGDATDQLLLRCRLLRWTVQTLRPGVSRVVLIGRIFAPRRAVKQSGHVMSEMVQGISIYKHSI